MSYGKTLALAFAVCAVAPFAARIAAQGLLPTGNQPVEIQADSGIEWQQDAQVYIARGHAVAVRGPAELHADTLIAHYRPTKPGTPAKAPSAEDAGAPGTEIYRVEADDNVTIKREGQTAVGDHAIYDIDQGVLVITGKALKLTTLSDVVTARDSLEWYEQKQVAVARGDAVAVRNGRTVKADTLTAYMVKAPPGGGKPGETKPGDAKAGQAKPGQAKPGPTKSAAAPARAIPAKAEKPATAAPPGAQDEASKISRIDAQGHVVVLNGPDTGRGDFGVYNTESGLCTLIGNVVITRATDVIRGQQAVMDLNNNVSRMLPVKGASNGQPQRVQGLFVRQDAPGGGQSAKPAAAPGKSP